MQRQSMFNYSQEFLNIDTKLNIPANPDGSHKLDKKFLSHLASRGIYVDCTIQRTVVLLYFVYAF
jgi:kynurenine 3-monooxygenase